MANNFSRTAVNNSNSTRTNDNISAREVRLLDENGEMLGVYPIEQALEMAYEASLDLVEISPDAKPPVCKIMDYGKHKYEMQKRKQEARKKQKIVVLKELQMHMNIAEHDYQVRLRKTQEFLANGNRVKIIIKLRGRERAHAEKAEEVLKRFYNDIGGEEKAKLEVGPKLEGNNAVLIFTAA